MTFQLGDTIAALASAAGPAGRGIIRASGPRAAACVSEIFAPADPARWSAAHYASAHSGSLRLAALRSTVPVLVYLWPHERSYTGQPLAEIHAPGSPPILEAVLASLFEIGARPAGRGEFTLRAFLAGRIDLVQAEAVLGVIDASDEQHLALALRQLAGGVSGRVGGVRENLLDLLADLEAGLDFVEDGIQFISHEEICRRIALAERALDDLLVQCGSRGQSTGRLRVVLAGLPNAGKSTLFNTLLGRDAALVSTSAGTTRDYLSGQADWNGLSVELIDTPGCDRHDDGIMQRAHELRRDQWEQADLIVWCSASDLSPDERRRDAELLAGLLRENRPVVIARTKADLLTLGPHAGDAGAPDHARDPNGLPIEPVPIRATTGEGLSSLVAASVRALTAPQSRGGDLVGSTAARCRESLFHGVESLRRALSVASGRLGDELIALEVRDALDQLGRILGTIYTDDVLDRIFGRFCIGK